MPAKEPTAFRKELDSGRIAPVYLLHGEETYLKEEAAEALRAAFLAPRADEAAFDLVVFEGASSTLAEIVDAALTLPLFSPRRMIWVKEAERLRDPAVQGLSEYLEAPSPATCLLFVTGAGKPDFRKALFKLLQQRAAVVEFRPLKSAALQRWIRERARSLGVEIDAEAASLLEIHAGPELLRMDQELKKAVDFTAPRRHIAAEDLAETLGTAAAGTVFEWAERAGAGETEEAIRLLRGILAEGEEPVRLLFLLVRQMRMLVLGKGLMKQGMKDRDLASALGLPPYPSLMDKVQRQIKNFPEAAGGNVYRLLLAADRSIKSGSKPPAVLERLVLDLRDLGAGSSASRQARR